MALENPGTDSAQLKEMVRQIVLAQGNDFIKDLLRTNGIKIGSTKEEFSVNLGAAIDSGKLTRNAIENWLSETEGWGNQHVYLFTAPGEYNDLTNRIRTSGYEELLGIEFSYSFPERLELTTVKSSSEGVSFVWQQAKEGWVRVPAKDYQQQEGLDLYRFEANRQRLDRSSIRFEWRFKDRFCAILIHRNKAIDHAEAIAMVFRTLHSVGLTVADFRTVLLDSEVMKASRDGDVSVQTTRLETHGGFVELGSTLASGGIEAVEPIRQARLGVNDRDFDRAQGRFHFRKDEKRFSRNISVEVIGREGRLRIWAQCGRDDVYHVIEAFV